MYGCTNRLGGTTGNTSSNYLETDSTLSPFNDDDAEICLQRQSLFSHMTDELCLAIRCQGSQQRTAFKRKCSKCRQIRKQYNQQLQKEAAAAASTSTAIETGTGTALATLTSTSTAAAPNLTLMQSSQSFGPLMH